MIRSHRQGLALALAVASLAFTTGCGGGLSLTPIRSAQKRPSNVAIYFKVQGPGGAPVGGLAADAFRIYEDGSLVSPFESKQVILNPEVAAAHYTLLLVDMSGSVSESGSAQVVVDAASTFVERVEASQKVAVFAFDGSPEVHPIAPFQSAGGAKGGVRALATYKPSDPSTNLNGAVMKGLTELKQALDRDPAPMKFGTLVVFTDGTDRAARVSKDDMKKAIRDSQYDVFAIGLGAELKEGVLGDIGKDGTAHAENRDAVVKAFDSIAQRVEGQTKSYYLLGYCSPARAGKHKVTIEAVVKGEGGKGERTGQTSAEFDATGFGPGCDPKTPPTFDVTKGDALAPPPSKEKEKDRDKDKDDKPKPKPKAAGGPTLPPPPPPPAKQDFNP